MLYLIPRYLPELAQLIADCGAPSVVDLAAALDVSPRTVFRWLERGEAPRAVLLALYWVTPYGWSAHETEARRRLQDWRALAEARRAELDALQARLDRFARLADFGSANGPGWRDGDPGRRPELAANDGGETVPPIPGVDLWPALVPPFFRPGDA